MAAEAEMAGHRDQSEVVVDPAAPSRWRSSDALICYAYTCNATSPLSNKERGRCFGERFSAHCIRELPAGALDWRGSMRYSLI